MKAQRIQVLPERLGQPACIERAVWSNERGFYIEEAILLEHMSEAERAAYEADERMAEEYEATFGSFGDDDQDACQPLYFATLEAVCEFDRLASQFSNLQEEARLIHAPDGLGRNAIEDAWQAMEAFVDAHALGRSRRFF
jgi:hypothetical protein